LKIEEDEMEAGRDSEKGRKEGEEGMDRVWEN